jgi:type IV secretion system protein VirD4
MTVDQYVRDRISQLKDRYSTQPVWPIQHCGAYLGMGARDPVFTGSEHAALIIGPPRSGKTSGILIPALSLWSGPAVTTSTKADIVQTTARCRSNMGTTWVLDPLGTGEAPDGAQRLRWSPMLGCADWDTAVDRAWMLTNAARPDPSGDGRHWTERATALLAPLLHAAAVAAQPMSTLVQWVHLRETWHALEYLSAEPRSVIAHHVLTGINQTDSRELSGIWSTVDSVLAVYRNQKLLAAADNPNFDPAAFVRSRDTLHIVLPSDRAGQYAPIVCALLDQIRQYTLRSPHWPMLWALDEIANTAPLPNLPTIVADAGSQGILILACLQDLAQARNRWGHQADGFLTLFTTTLLLPGVADPTTLKTVTTLAGRVDRPQQSITKTGLIGRQITTSTRPLPLLPENVIAHGRQGHALHLRTTYPAWLRLTPWHSTPWLAERL